MYFACRSAISKRLYRYLDKKRYGKNKFEINIFTLAEKRLGLSKTKYASQIKEKLDPAHEELIKGGYLRDVKYMPTKDGKSEKILYYFINKDKKFKAFDVITDKKDAEEEKKIKRLEYYDKKRDEWANEKAELMNGLMMYQFKFEELEKKLKLLPAPVEVVAHDLEEKEKKLKEQESAILEIQAEKKRLKDASLRAQEAAEAIRTRMEDLESQIEQKKAVERLLQEYIESLSQEENAALKERARQLATESAGKFLGRDKVPDFIVDSYFYLLVEKEIGFPTEV